MGVPRLFPYIQQRFKAAVQHFQPHSRTIGVDYAYLDSNGALHSACQYVFNYGEHKRMPPPYQDKSYDQKILLVYEMYWNSILEVVELLHPTKVLYIAIDGPAPLTKQAQQRQRRFVAAKAREEAALVTTPLEVAGGVWGGRSPPQTFDSNCITPGTLFMLGLTKYLNDAIRREMNKSGLWRGLTVIFSPPTVPGEGEHKILNYIRRLPEAERMHSSHALFGPDGDLLLLCLAAHVPKILLLREDQFEPGYYYLVNLGMVREDLPRVMGLSNLYAATPSTSLKDMKQTALNSVSDDFLLLAELLGDDFVPKIQMFYLLEEGLDLVVQTYLTTSQGGRKNRLTSFDPSTKRATVNLESLAIFIEALSVHEVPYLLDQASRKLLDPRFKNLTLKKHTTGDPPNKLDFEGYRKDYYLKSKVVSETEIRGMCLDYLSALVFVFEYYVQGLPSWTSFYHWHYAPLMTDLAQVLKSLTEDEKVTVLKVQVDDEPSRPFVQLLSVLPPASSSLLPPIFAPLMHSPDSPLVQAGYYRTDFAIDYEGKTKEHMGVVLINFVDVAVIKEAYQPLMDQLKNRYVRNERTRPYHFRYNPYYTSRYTSDYGVIYPLHVQKTYGEVP